MNIQITAEGDVLHLHDALTEDRFQDGNAGVVLDLSETEMFVGVGFGFCLKQSTV